MDERGRGWGRALVLVAALPGIVWGLVTALGVGDADASGIVEESLGGAGTALVLGVFFIGVPALMVGTLDGLAERIARPVLRLLVQVGLLAGFGLWAGLWIYGFADIDCDGTCIDPDRGVIWTTLAVALVALALERAVAGLIGRRARRRRAAASHPHGPET